MSLRQEFVLLARQPDANIRELCRRFAISPATAYKLLKRYADQGQAGLTDHSRRPQTSPGRTPGGPSMSQRQPARLRVGHQT